MDYSYCFRIPKSFIPSYLANVSNIDMRDAKHGLKTNPEKYLSTCELFDATMRYPEDYATGVWDVGI